MVRSAETPPGWADDARRIGLRLQRARHKLGLSQEEVAHRGGISAYTYQKFEKGESRPGSPMNPRLITLVNLCRALDLELAELLDPVFGD